MLANTLPLLPFHHTRLAKKEWVNDRQEKKGRVIDLEELRQSFHLDEYLSSEESSSSSEEETESSEYSDSEEEEPDPYGDDFDWYGHIDSLLPEAVEL